jgi:hypothetical protein
MLNMWPILISWSAIVLIVALLIIGIIRRQMAWFVVATIIISPYAFYLFGTPRFRWIALAFPLLLIGAGLAIRRSHPLVAWSFFVLFLGLCGWIAVIVIRA